MIKKTLPVFAVPVVLLLAGVTALAFALLTRPAAPPPMISESSSIAVTATPAPDTALAPAPAPVSPVVRVNIPRIAVDAGIVTLGVDPNGTMQAPATPTDAAWYRFSAKPGQVGNVVMAGHVDYLNYGPAVFYRLRELKPGDEIVLDVEDGRRFTYKVASVGAYEDLPQAVADAVGPTSTESVTLITCTGDFNRATGQYDRRLVVRADRAL